MLNTMRKNLKSLSWVLWLTVASFVIAIFAVWGGGRDAGGVGATWMARVNGNAVSVQEFQNAYANLDRFYQQIYQQNYDARSLGVARQALNQLIRDLLIRQEARRLGLRASPQEISRAITKDPTFQLDGRFIGLEQYKKFLSDRGVDIAGYERSVGQDLLAAKYRRLITDSITVSPEEVLADYLARNEKVAADYFLLKAEDLAAGIEVDEVALQEFFAAHSGDYLTPERRRGTYVLINQERLGGREPAAEEAARSYYEENRERLYTNPEQVRASQILLNVPPGSTPDEVAAIRARAEDLLLRARSGEDFGELARSYSEDTSQTLGGDLGFFGRGRMPPAFDDAAFSLATGETSEVVQTELGFHIIRITDRRDAGVQPFSEVRDAILRQLEFSRGQEAVSEAVTSFREEVELDPTQFTVAAARLGLTLEDTDVVSAGDSVAALGDHPQIVQALFRAEVGSVSPPITLPQGTVFLQTLEVRQPEPLSFDLARAEVEADYRRQQGLEAARERIRLAGDETDLPALAQEFGASVESTVEFTREQPLEPFSADARRAAFAATPGGMAEPVEVPEGLLVFTVTEHQGLDQEAFEAAETNLRRSLLQRRRNLLFSAVVDQLHTENQVQVNEALLDQIEGRGA